MNNKKWYVVYISDHRRIGSLSVAMNAITDDYEIWIPTKVVFVKRKNKLVEIDKPLFPGYVFIHFDFADGAAQEVIRKTCGGQFLHGPGKRVPSVLSDDDVESIKSLMDETQVPKSVAENYNLTEGQKVEVTTGPFIGHKGLVKHIKREKVVVEITIFNRSVLAEVDPSSCNLAEN